MEKVSFFEDWHSVLFNGRNELVFEGKNKSYGAYAIRKGYSSTVTTATGIALSTGALVIALLAFYSDKPQMRKIPVNDGGEVFIIQPPPVEPPPPAIKPPVKATTSPAVSTIANVTIKPSDVLVNDPPPTQDDLKGKNTGPVTIKGPDIVEVTPPKDLPIEPGIIENTTTLEELPEFPGGYSALMSFLKNNIRYPQAELENAIQGKIFLSFVVNTDGSITNIEVIKGIPGGANLDAEALRVVKIMPNWSPGKQNGKTVRVKYTLPVQFKTIQ